jgi:hypothetical protein
MRIIGCTYYDALKESHSLDFLGCSNSLVQYCTFTGFDPSPDRAYVETIQLDGSSAVGANNLVLDNNTYDGIASKNISVENCQFLPLRDANGKIIKPSPNPFGCHRFVQGHWYSGLRFVNNYVEDAVPYGNLKYSPNYWESIDNTGSWLRFYATKADPLETNPLYQGVGILIENNIFKSTETEDLAFIENGGQGVWDVEFGMYMGTKKNPVQCSAIYIQTKNEGANPSDEALKIGWSFDEHGFIQKTTERAVPQPCEDVLITGNTFEGFNTELTGRPVIGVGGYVGDDTLSPVYGDSYAKNIEISYNTFLNCYDNAKATANKNAGISPSNNISSDCIYLSYVDDVRIYDNEFNNVKRMVYAVNVKNLDINNNWGYGVHYIPISLNMVDGFDVQWVEIDTNSTGGFYTVDCKNGSFENNRIIAPHRASSSYNALIAIKQGANIQAKYNTLTNSTDPVKKHTYALRAYANNITSNDTINDFATPVSIE